MFNATRINDPLNLVRFKYPTNTFKSFNVDTCSNSNSNLKPCYTVACKKDFINLK
jgi:hypothetical protein